MILGMEGCQFVGTSTYHEAPPQRGGIRERSGTGVQHVPLRTVGYRQRTAPMAAGRRDRSPVDPAGASGVRAGRQGRVLRRPVHRLIVRAPAAVAAEAAMASS